LHARLKYQQTSKGLFFLTHLIVLSYSEVLSVALKISLSSKCQNLLWVQVDVFLTCYNNGKGTSVSSRHTYQVTNSIDIMVNQWKSTDSFHRKPDHRWRPIQIFKELNVAGNVTGRQRYSYWRRVQDWNINTTKHSQYIVRLEQQTYIPQATESFTTEHNR